MLVLYWNSWVDWVGFWNTAFAERIQHIVHCIMWLGYHQKWGYLNSELCRFFSFLSHNKQLRQLSFDHHKLMNWVVYNTLNITQIIAQSSCDSRASWTLASQFAQELTSMHVSLMALPSNSHAKKNSQIYTLCRHTQFAQDPKKHIIFAWPDTQSDT